MSKPMLDRLELRVIIWWAGALADASTSVCRCREVSKILRAGLQKQSRQSALESAPMWVREAWPQYYRQERQDSSDEISG